MYTLQELQGDTLDASQQLAVRHALRNSIALIQGPPGTGKTRSIVKIIQTIVKCSEQIIIFVACTNHALDQVMEAIEDKGNPHMVRIGGQSKSARLEEYNLSNLARSMLSSESSRVYELTNRMYALHKQIKQLNSRIVEWNDLLLFQITCQLRMQQDDRLKLQEAKLVEQQQQQQWQGRQQPQQWHGRQQQQQEEVQDLDEVVAAASGSNVGSSCCCSCC